MTASEWVGFALCMGFAALGGFVFTMMWLEPKLWLEQRLHEKERNAHEATALKYSEAEELLNQVRALVTPRPE